jgi:glycosyltransferase involved in cell wall biosynthesis
VDGQRPKISVITPSFNSGSKLRRAIESVLAQNFSAFEHIVVDAGSTDETLDIIKTYPHLVWVSEPDNGQSDALNKGFAMSKGDIIVSLNCDDYFSKNAFNLVVPYFDKGAQFVVGNIEVNSFRLGRSFANNAKIEMIAMMRHWEPDAYCYNPIGYFYTRAVQQACPFNVNNEYTLDLEFLLDAAAKFPIVKVNHLLGYYDEDASSKTTRSQADQGYWTIDNFAFVERHISTLPANAQIEFRRERKRGYARITRYWQRREKIIQLREKIRALGKKMFS